MQRRTPARCHRRGQVARSAREGSSVGMSVPPVSGVLIPIASSGRRSRLMRAGSRARGSTSPNTRPCGSGRRPTSKGSGPRSGSRSTSPPRCRTSASSARGRCRGRSGCQARASTSQSMHSAPGIPMRSRSATRPSCGPWRSGARRNRWRGSPEGLRTLGVGPGDRVERPRTVAAFLACASIGCWSSCSPTSAPGA